MKATETRQKARQIEMKISKGVRDTILEEFRSKIERRVMDLSSIEILEEVLNGMTEKEIHPRIRISQDESNPCDCRSCRAGITKSA